MGHSLDIKGEGTTGRLLVGVRCKKRPPYAQEDVPRSARLQLAVHIQEHIEDLERNAIGPIMNSNTLDFPDLEAAVGVEYSTLRVSGFSDHIFSYKPLAAGEVTDFSARSDTDLSPRTE